MHGQFYLFILYATVIFEQRNSFCMIVSFCVYDEIKTLEEKTCVFYFKTHSLKPLFKHEHRTFLGEYMKVDVINKPQADEYGFVTKTKFAHHNYTEMETFLKDMNETYPNITYLRSIGKSVQGRELYVMVVSSTPFEHVAGKALTSHT